MFQRRLARVEEGWGGGCMTHQPGVGVGTGWGKRKQNSCLPRTQLEIFDSVPIKYHARQQEGRGRGKGWRGDHLSPPPPPSSRMLPLHHLMGIWKKVSGCSEGRHLVITERKQEACVYSLFQMSFTEVHVAHGRGRGHQAGSGITPNCLQRNTPTPLSFSSTIAFSTAL